MFLDFDKNHDGQLSWEEIWTSIHPLEQKIKAKSFKWHMEPGILPSEFKTQVRQMFEVSDMNHDNVLELDEYKQFTLYLLESLSAGVIGEDSTPIGDLFASFDKNKDGRLDWEEIWESMTVITEKLAEKATDKTATPLK